MTHALVNLGTLCSVLGPLAVPVSAVNHIPLGTSSSRSSTTWSYPHGLVPLPDVPVPGIVDLPNLHDHVSPEFMRRVERLTPLVLLTYATCAVRKLTIESEPRQNSKIFSATHPNEVFQNKASEKEHPKN